MKVSRGTAAYYGPTEFKSSSYEQCDQPCSTCRGGHATWTCLDCGGVVYGPPLTAECRILVAAAAVR
jgi:hypothetical protein